MLTEEQYQKWIEALESGNYIKGRNWLKRTVDNVDTYCCLGVLCETLGYESNVPDTKLTESFSNSTPGTVWEFVVHTIDSDTLKIGHMAYITPYINAPSIIPYSVQMELADVNDVCKTFTPVIEKIKELKEKIVVEKVLE